MNDLRFALRQLAKSPAFTALAVLTLGLAVGLNSAIFAVINGALLKPLSPGDARELVSVYNRGTDAHASYRLFSAAEFDALRAPNEVFADTAASLFALAGITRGRDEGPRRSLIALTSDNYFTLLGTKPLAGRFFNATEARPGSAVRVAVASHAAWQRMGGRPDFVGSILWVNGQPCTVIGITRPEFSGVSAFTVPELWLPLGLAAGMHSPFNGGSSLDLTNPQSTPLHLLARLHAGTNREAAAARLPALATRISELPANATGRLRELQIEAPSRVFSSARPGNEREIKLLATGLIGLAGCVLLIANLNLANMLLARGASRASEIAVRLALGAARGHVVRQLLVEGSLLALFGGAFGLLLGTWANSALLASLAAAIKGTMNATLALRLEPDFTVVGITFALCAVSTLVFSLGPALQSSRTDVVTALKNPGSAVAGTRWNRFFAGRNVLVMVQLALSFVLLFSAGLFFRGAVKAGDVALGFEPRGSLVTEIDFSLLTASPAEAQRRLASVMDHVRRMPGVDRVAASTQAPMGNFTIARRVGPAAAEPTADVFAPSAIHTAVSTGYFRTIGVPLRRGRDFSELETREPSAARVAILDESLARALFPQGDALGQRVRFAGGTGDHAAEMEVVGIVGSHRHEVLEHEPSRRIFVPMAQGFGAVAFVHTRLRNHDPDAVAAMTATLRSELRRIDPSLPILRHQPFVDFVEKDDSLWTARAGAALFGALGVLALLLAMIGTYGVRAYTVTRRTREFGVRVALGAQPADIIKLILKQGVLQTALALVVGMILALAVGRVLGAFLFQVSPLDSVAVGGALAILSTASLAASYLPARRATRADAITALRAE